MVLKKMELQERLLQVVVLAMQAKKARKVTLLDLRNVEKAVCDYLAEEVEERVGTAVGEWPMRISGKENALWIVIDYFTVVVHVFSTAMREFYDLDALWADAKRTEFPDED